MDATEELSFHTVSHLECLISYTIESTNNTTIINAKNNLIIVIVFLLLEFVFLWRFAATEQSHRSTKNETELVP